MHKQGTEAFITARNALLSACAIVNGPALAALERRNSATLEKLEKERMRRYRLSLPAESPSIATIENQPEAPSK